VFCIYLRTNSDLCHLYHKLIGFYNRDEKCLLRGTNWVLNIQSALRLERDKCQLLARFLNACSVISTAPRSRKGLWILQSEMKRCCRPRDTVVMPDPCHGAFRKQNGMSWRIIGVNKTLELSCNLSVGSLVKSTVFCVLCMVDSESCNNIYDSLNILRVSNYTFFVLFSFSPTSYVSLLNNPLNLGKSHCFRRTCRATNINFTDSMLQ
jgi:hypothetical protein